MDQHSQLISQIKSLRDFLAQFNTETFAKYIANDWLIKNNQYMQIGKTAVYDNLVSPERQTLYLYGQLMCSIEPNIGSIFDDDDWKLCCDLLNKIFVYYANDYSQIPVESEQVVKDLVANQEFLYANNMGSRMTDGHLLDYLNKYYIPFDKELHLEFGISASIILEMIQWVESKIKSDWEKLLSLTGEHGNLSKLISPSAQDIDVKNDDVVSEVFDLFGELFTFNTSDLILRFGTDAFRAFDKLFISERGHVTTFDYIDDNNEFRDAPLIKHSESLILCPPIINWLYEAAITKFESTLSSSNHITNYAKRRSSILERHMIELLQDFKDPNTKILNNVFETSDLHFEHDIVVLHRNTLVVIECKAGKKQKPFYNTEKAYKRLVREFKSDTGVQKAYDQGMRLYNKWKSGEEVKLYDSQKHLVLSMKASEIDSVYCICLSRENIGQASFTIPKLLSKGIMSPYPWVVSIFDFERYVSTWNVFSWDWLRLLDFLEQRIRLYGICISTDEVEYLGFYVHHGRLEYLFRNGVVYLDQDYSSIIDMIYYREDTGREFIFSPKPPAPPNSIYENGYVKYWYSL